jgi:hypothetical protein
VETDTTSIIDAAKDMTSVQCLDRGAEENAKGEEADLIAGRISGKWYNAAKTKVIDNKGDWTKELEAHCNSKGHSVRTAQRNMQIDDNWERVMGEESSRPTDRVVRDLQPIAPVPDWRKQRDLWQQLIKHRACA